ncbi:hypothetical protein ACJIZ3_012148 [Penstemon smallii]|uniref:Transcription repressor n=1 Tax=Penstemon smallii TaxID=265156 RepID=A0ABD3UL58_9LAMI
MSSNKRWKFNNIFTAKTGCGCGPKATDIIEPKPRTSFSNPTNFLSSSASSVIDDNEHCPESHSTKILDSLAVVKDSEDPYQDFRQSMLQMIFEKDIYSRDDLQQLLHCFLRLNSKHHHQIIVRAFMEIWNGGGAAAAEEEEEEETPLCPLMQCIGSPEN